MSENVPTKPFQFLEGRPSKAVYSQESEKENVVARLQSQPVNGSQKRAESPSKPPPSTPATRLPLADLIGTTDEDRIRLRPTETSPDDHIDWAPTSSSKRKAKATPARKSNKRARSISPSSSASKQVSGRKEPLDLEALKRDLRTPQNDHVADVVHYGPGWNTVTPLNFNLQYSSSPQTDPDQDGNVAGLRRWTSCGIGFPSARAKRRRLEPVGARESVQEVFGARRTLKEETLRVKRPSNINSLLERIQESLSKQTTSPKAETHDPSSSSPMPEKQEGFDRKSVSPRRAPELADQVAGDISEADGNVEAEEIGEPKSTSRGLNQKASSSFGSDDMDVQILAGLEQAGIRDSLASKSLPDAVVHDPSLSSKTALNPEVYDDEFDDDNDLTAEDFENAGLRVTEKTEVGISTYPVATPQTIRRTALLSNSPAKEDEYGDLDLDDDDFAAAEAAATQQAADSSSGMTSDPKTRIIQRYLVTEVVEGIFQTEKGARRPEKVIQLKEERTGRFKALTLQESWFDTRCTKGSYVHVIGRFDDTGHCVVNDAENILILHPDHLVSALVVADSFTCMRRAVLQDRVKATSDSNQYIMYGTMLHELFQEALKANRWDSHWLHDTIDEIVQRHLEDVYENKISLAEVKDHMRSKMPELQGWARTFVTSIPKSSGIVKDRQDAKVLMSINKLLDVEEHVWSPMYGLKGNVDATLQVTMQDDEGERQLVVPFEIKTGRSTSSASHRAQTALYTLLLSDRYDIEIAFGILYYLESSQISRIPAIRHELRHMIMQRNELACYIRERLTLPQMVRNTHQCSKCYAKQTCFIYHKLAEKGDGETSGLRAKFDAVVKNLGPLDQTFFTKWDELLTKEESEMMKFKRELWTMLSKDRERLGRCFSNVVLEAGSAKFDPESSKINRFQYTFQKQTEATDFSFHESQIGVGEPIVISDEAGHYALAKGYVIQIQDRRITVAVDRKLHNARVRQKGFDAWSNQSFSAIMDVDAKDCVSQKDTSGLVYRLDKDEFSNGMALARNNVVQLMNDETFRSRRLRELIVHAQEPNFKSTATAKSFSISGPASQANINADQKAAIEKILSAEDYALILGMPGTGKTTTIAHIIRTLVSKGKSVLLASYTHTAVDNILLKIRHDKIGVLRLGAIAKIHPEVRDFAVLGAEPKQSLEELERAYTEPQVVATTCLGINHQVFNQRIFDYCIVDEASQITLPVCLGPIRMAKTFVLVGDHYQLPPLVQNDEAQKGGLDISLFKLLSERHESAVSTLCHQYRMNEEIMSLSNQLIYSGRLVCGSKANADRRLNVPNFERISRLHKRGPSACGTLENAPSCWLDRVLNPKTSSPVVFLNTDLLRPDAFDKAQGAHIVNLVEASLTAQIVHTLLLTGVPANTVGVTTLYRSQLALIKTLLLSSEYGLQGGQATAVEAHTTDRFQGRDKEVMVLSCVRNNDRNFVGDLLKDWRRVNVAVTRAKSKLVIIGSRETLSEGDALLKQLVQICEQNCWIVDLRPGDHEAASHDWNTLSVPASSASNIIPPVRAASQALSPMESHNNNSNTPTKTFQAGHPRPRIPLGPRAANLANPKNPQFKSPLKTANASLGVRMGMSRGSQSSKLREKRPVLADIISDVVGEDFLSLG